MPGGAHAYLLCVSVIFLKLGCRFDLDGFQENVLGEESFDLKSDLCCVLEERELDVADLCDDWLILESASGILPGD